MKATISVDMTLGDIAAQYPQTRFVMEQLALDYCCGGKKTLRESATQAGRDPDDVLAALTRAIENRPAQDQIDFTTLPPAQLVDYIKSSHHLWLRQHLPRISALMEKVSRAHARAHGEMLHSLAEVVEILRADISLHLEKEEQILFPYIRQLDACRRNRVEMPPMHCGTVQNPIRQMEYEHDEAGAALAKMRDITDSYRLPADACESFKALYDELHALELDLHQHIHLENNILFPKAIALEDEVAHRQTT